MLQLGIWLIWLALYHYYIEQIGELEKGYKKRIVVWGLTLGAVLAAGILKLIFVPLHGNAGLWLIFGSWLMVMLILLLYVLFYDGNPSGSSGGKC